MLDACGALVTALVLLMVAMTSAETFGVPAGTLKLLSVIALFYSLFSAACAVRRPVKWRSYMIVIASANLAYCCLTATLMLYEIDHITVTGTVYFTAEIVVITTLAVTELKIAK